MHLCLHFKLNIPRGKTKIFGKPLCNEDWVDYSLLVQLYLELTESFSVQIEGTLSFKSFWLSGDDITSMFLDSFPRRHLIGLYCPVQFTNFSLIVVMIS